MKILLSAAVVFVIAALLIAIFWKQLPFRLILPYVQQRPILIEGDVQKITYTGDKAGEQTYFVYLPTGYNDSDQRYPVLYHLHGAFVRESWAGYECNNIGVHMERAVAAGIVEPMIIVCPVDPDGNRMWSDSYDGQFLQGTALVEDLVPHVDATYRTHAVREQRALQGFSMGGFGAVTNGFRSAELFSAVIIWDGALHNWQTISSSRQSITSKMFSNEAHFDLWSPWEWTKTTAETDPALMFIVGTMDATSEFASRFKPHLEGTGRDFIYHKIDCPHSMFCMLDELGIDAFTFLANTFQQQ